MFLYFLRSMYTLSFHYLEILEIFYISLLEWFINLRFIKSSKHMVLVIYSISAYHDLRFCQNVTNVLLNVLISKCLIEFFLNSLMLFFILWYFWFIVTSIISTIIIYEISEMYVFLFKFLKVNNNYSFFKISNDIVSPHIVPYSAPQRYGVIV